MRLRESKDLPTSSIRAIVEEVRRERNVPGIVVAYTRGDGPVEHLSTGIDASGTPLAPETLLPVASVTKLGTALALLRLAARGALSIDDPLSSHLPQASAAVPGVTLRRLLCHTSGLPFDLPPGAAPYAPGLDWPALARACLTTPLQDPPMTRVRYSNIGPGLLARIVEMRTGLPFPSALRDLVLDPLQIDGWLGEAPPRPVAKLTGSLGKHAGTEIEAYNSPFWRSLGLPWGGLITTAAGALALVRAFSGVPPDFLPDDLRADATGDSTEGLPGGLYDSLAWPKCPWGLGPELRGEKAPHHSPQQASPGSFGHVGASGSLAWSDPEAGISWAVLGTRTFETWWKDLGRIGGALYSIDE